MTEVDVYLVSTFAVLCGFLYWRITRRLRNEIARQKALEKENPGKAFETAAISPRIQRIRQDFVSAARWHRGFPCGRKARIATARCALARLGFFSKWYGSARASGDSGQSESTETAL